MTPLRSRSPLTAALVSLTLVGGACNQEIRPTEELTTMRPSSDDAAAGNWRMIVLTGPTQISVPPPSPANSDAYRAEVAAIKAAQGALTDAQREAIEYWSVGGILRWNQIMRGLVARADLPPAPREDGTYPVPDADNPFADPQFPFGNPPYAARAYSAVSVAQFEALKVAWYYKYLYGRPSPARVDSGVQALMPVTDLPAYPSEDAVVSGVTAELLRTLFPTSVEEITRRAAQQREAAVLSGRSTASDVAAGVALGRAVAPFIAARLATDGMRTAGGTPAQVQAMANAARARGEEPWRSLESPPRPPMLANFGQVRAWNMTPTDIVTERPGPPPSTSSAQMQQELAEVRAAVQNLTREQLAIAHFWADGLSTSTPPGHWNGIAIEYVKNAQFSEVRAARAFAYVNMALHDAGVACWETKFFYFNPRPSQLDPAIRTAVGLPNFPAYTSGHSTFSASAAAVLSYLFPSGASFFDAQMEEAAISRLYGGIHYRSDIEVGKTHGTRVGAYTVAFARQDGAN
jgi:hypothetical protein